MVLKERDFPNKILKLEALLRRIVLHHASRNLIERELAISYAGYRGEQSINYFIDQLPQKDHYIFRGLRLPHSETAYFQVDTLLMSQRYFINFETKNIGGELYIDRNQMTRTLDDKKDSFPDPILQAENQQYHLENFIKKATGTTIPNTSFVVMANTTSIILPNPQYRAVAEKVIRPPAIRKRVQMFDGKHEREILDKKQFKKLSKLLLKMDSPAESDVVANFQIGEDEILPGGFCDDCQSLSIVRLKRQWRCTKCGKVDRKAHIHALIDYCLLVGPTISPLQLRNFLRLDSSSIASKLLRSLNLPFSGDYKNRVYHLSLEELQRM